MCRNWSANCCVSSCDLNLDWFMGLIIQNDDECLFSSWTMFDVHRLNFKTHKIEYFEGWQLFWKKQNVETLWKTFKIFKFCFPSRYQNQKFGNFQHKKLSFFCFQYTAPYAGHFWLNTIYCFPIRTKTPDELIILTLSRLTSLTHPTQPVRIRKSTGSFTAFFSSSPSSPTHSTFTAKEKKNRLTIRMHARSIDFMLAKMKEFWVKTNVYLTDSSRVSGWLKQ